MAYSIQGAFAREHRRAGDVLVGFVKGGFLSFIKGDAPKAARLLHEPIIQGEVCIPMVRFEQARDLLVHAGVPVVFLEHTTDNFGQWRRLDFSGLYDLSRFEEAHSLAYEDALEEIRLGEKTTHWIRYIFPQIAGLGLSETSRIYAIKDIGEAKGFFDHPILGAHYRECCHALLAHAGKKSAIEIFGDVDAMKVRSSMTLFLRTGFRDARDLCQRVLNFFYDGEEDLFTLARLGNSVFCSFGRSRILI